MQECFPFMTKNKSLLQIELVHSMFRPWVQVPAPRGAGCGGKEEREREREGVRREEERD